MVTPDARRAIVKHWREKWKFSERQACKLARLPRNTNRYRKKPNENGALREHLQKLAVKYPRLGQGMLSMMLRNSGWKVNHKRVERLYREEKLALRRRKRRKFRLLRQEQPRATVPMQSLSLDFMRDGPAARSCQFLVGSVARRTVCRPGTHSLEMRSWFWTLDQTDPHMLRTKKQIQFERHTQFFSDSRSSFRIY